MEKISDTRRHYLYIKIPHLILNLYRIGKDSFSLCKDLEKRTWELIGIKTIKQEMIE